MDAKTQSPWKRLGVLALIVVFAFGLRALGSKGRGYPFSFYPDEDGNLQRAVQIYQPSDGGFDLNLHWFNKPSLGFYLNFGELGFYYMYGRHVTGEFASASDFAHAFFNDRGPFYFVVRLWNGVLAALTVLLTYLIGKRFGGIRCGLIAAAVLALIPGHVLWSQVVKHDILAGFFAAWSFLFVLKVLERGRMRDYLLAGLMAGLGTASKYSPVVMGLPLIIAHFIAMGDGRVAARSRAGLIRLGSGLFAILGGFFVGSPFNFLDGQWLRENVIPQSKLAKTLLFGAGEVTEEDSFLGLFVRLGSTIVEDTALSSVLFVLVAIGALMALRSDCRKPAILGIATIAAFAFVFCGANQQYPRANHVVPIYSFAAVFIAVLANGFCELLAAKGVSARRALIGLLLVLMLPLPGFPGKGHYTILHDVFRDHPQSVAFDWIQKNIPEGATILNDHTVVSLGMTDERLAWIKSRIDEELARSKRGLERIEEGEEDADKKRAYHEDRIDRYGAYATKYRLLTEASANYAKRRYDVIIVHKPWQSDERADFDEKKHGYNDIWDSLPVISPPDLAPLERYRVLKPALPADTPKIEKRRFPVVIAPVDFVVTRKESYANYQKASRRKNWPEWAAFYDDLALHYDCWEFPELHTRQRRGTVRIYDLRTRKEFPEVRIVDLAQHRR